MKKTAIILAGAVAFDLGVLVVAGHAAEAPKAPAAAPATEGVSLNFAKIKVDYIYMKLDAINTARACDHKYGKVVDVAGMPMCQLPAKAAPAPDSRGTRAAPVPDGK